MADKLPFVEFEKIARLNREVIVTEKIDGTNAQIHIRPADGSELEVGYDTPIFIDKPYYMRAGSRNRWVPFIGTDDNNGFGRWVHKNAHDLAMLGEGSHFGEWWGQGIQRKYGLTEKRFSLFNVSRWLIEDEEGQKKVCPACCDVVPLLAKSIGFNFAVEKALAMLRELGSFAAPGFMRPEGIVIYHTASRSMFKVTLERDQEPKGKHGN